MIVHLELSLTSPSRHAMPNKNQTLHRFAAADSHQDPA